MFVRIFQSLLLLLPVILGLTGMVPFLASAACGALACLSLSVTSLSPSWPPVRRFEGVLLEANVLMEALSLAILAAALHQVAPLSGLTLLPLVLRRELILEHFTKLAYFVAVFVLFASWAVTQGIVPTWYELCAASGVALVGTLLGFEANRSTVTVTVQNSYPESTMSLSGEQPIAFPDEQRILEYRESYRRLKGMYDELLRRSDSDRASMCLIDWRFGDSRTIKELAHALRNAAEVDGAAIYTVPDIRDGMVLAGASGSAPAEARTLQVPVQAAPILIRERAAEALRALKKAQGTACENVILLDRGRLVGLAALYDNNQDRIAHGKRVLEEISPLLARLLRDEQEAEGLRTRAVRAELLADMGTRYLDTPRVEAAQGICEDLLANLKLEGCVITSRQNGSFSHLGASGDPVGPVLEALIMGQSQGLYGWAESGARELVIPEARDDVRFDRLVAVRKGVGMLVILPMFSSGRLVGALTAWTEEAHGINAAVLATLRAVIPHALRRCLGGFPSTRPGLVDSETFWNGSQGPGSFVEIDLGRGEDGNPSDSKNTGLQQARRKLLATAISRLPQGGLLTRRPTGTLVAFLAGFDEDATRTWAKALDPITGGNWGMSIKVLGFSPQSIQFLRTISA